MDAPPSRNGDREPYGRALSSRSCLENSEGHEVDLTTTGQTSAGAQTTEGETLAEGDLADPKKKPAAKRPGSSSRTKAEYPNAPRSVGPGRPGGNLLFNWKNDVALGRDGLSLGRSARSSLLSNLPDSYNTERLIAFLEDLRQEVRGQKVILVWDGLPAHKSRVKKEYRSRNDVAHGRVSARHAPGLNPVENLWGNLKGQESDTPRGAGGLVSGAASKAVVPLVEASR
jgi:DDE superfamily endonuclease